MGSKFSREGYSPYWKSYRYALSQLERNDSNVTELDLCDQIMGDSGAGALAAALPGNTNLTKLYVCKCDIGDGGTMALASMLQHTSITFLFMDGNRIGDLGAVTLGAALKQFEQIHVRNRLKLQSLGLFHNQIGIVGSKALADGLQHQNCILQRITLGRNRIGNEGAVAFGNALRTNRSLKVLDLTAASIGDEGALGLCDGLEQNHSLRHLLLGHNQIGDEGVHAFAGIIAIRSDQHHGTRLQRLDLRRNPWTAESVHVLARAVGKNYFLEQVHLTGCDLPKEIELHSSLRDMHFALRLNAAGRRLLREENNNMPTSIWPLVLARVGYQPDLMYFFVHSKPELCKGSIDILSQRPLVS